VMSQANLWPTVDGSIAWNQWYPHAHTTVWAIAQQAIDTTVPVSRIELLPAYVQWSAVSVALCLAALAWLAGDLAERFAKMRDVSMAAAGIVAVLGFAAFAVLGSPTVLFNAGFTNFLMAATVAIVGGYLAARSWQSARKLGWILVPIGAVVVTGLWTPLVAAFVLPGVIVLIALWRVRPYLAIIWALVSGALIGWFVLQQARDILGVDTNISTTEFAQNLGAVPVGMVGFNISAAITFPLIALIIAGVLIRERRLDLGFAIAGAPFGIGLVLLIALQSAAAAEVAWQVSYYVLKVLDALLLVSAPVVAALLAASMVVVVRSVGRVMAVTGSIVALLLAVAMFGYIGPAPAYLNTGFTASPGILAAEERHAAVANAGLGEDIVASVLAVSDDPDRFPLMWDTSGTLPNLWAASLHTVLSRNAQSVYIGLPAPPYAQDAAAYLDFSLTINPKVDLAVVWSDPASQAFLIPLAEREGDQVTLIRR
jgi:hypothetical protein